MSYEALEWSFRLKHDNPTHKNILHGLANHANKYTARCNPSILRLCKYSALAKSTVIRAIQEMEALGMISSIHGKGRKTVYQLHLDWGEPHVFPAHAKTQPDLSTGPAAGPVNSSNWSQSGTQLVPQRDSTGPRAGPKPSITLKEPIDSRFDEFFDAYPESTSRPIAKKAYQKALTKVSHDEIMDGLGRYISSQQGKDPSYIPAPAKWLGEERWADQLSGQAKPATNVWPGAEPFIELHGTEVWNAWFSDCILRRDGDEAVIEVPTEFKREHIKDHWLDDLKRAMGNHQIRLEVCSGIDTACHSSATPPREKQNEPYLRDNTS